MLGSAWRPNPHLSSNPSTSSTPADSFAAFATRSSASTGYQSRRRAIEQAGDVEGLDRTVDAREQRVAGGSLRATRGGGRRAGLELRAERRVGVQEESRREMRLRSDGEPPRYSSRRQSTGRSAA